MAKPAKKDLEKRRKERDQKRQGVSERAQAAGITPFVERLLPLPAPHVDFPVSPSETGTVPNESTTGDWAKEILAAPKPQRPPPPEKTEQEKQIDRWWQEYKVADGETRAQMAREKLAALDPDDELFEAFFPDAISEVESRIGRERYVAFLEEIRDRWPRVFVQEIDWNVWQMAFVYIADERWADLERAVGQLADELKERNEPFYSLLSLLRLANRNLDTQRLVTAAKPSYRSRSFMPWTMDRILGSCLFQLLEEFVQTGADEEALDRFWRQCLDLGAEDKEETREVFRTFGRHLAGLENKRWTRHELLGSTERIGIDLLMLLTDYQRWLCTARSIAPLVADEFRLLLVEALYRMKGDVLAFLDGLKRTVFEPHLAWKLDFMSLDRFHVPASILAMYHFYDFLTEIGLVDERIRQPSQTVCLDLWNEITSLFKDKLGTWRYCQFLERYATWTEK